jgi:hypothetical protein
MARSLISLNLLRLTYAALAVLAQAVHDGFVLLVAIYALPNPTMVNFQTHIDALNAAILAWGPKGARGSHAQHMALIAAANIVRNDLRQLAAYAMNTTPDDPDSWVLLGFSVKRPKTAPVRLQAVQNLHNFISRDLVAGTIKLKWKRPLNTDRADIKCYIVQYNDTNVQPQIDGGKGVVNVIGLTTDTAIIIPVPFVGANYFWVTPFNSVGYGVSSGEVLINAPGKLA